MAVRKALAHQPGRDNLTWGDFVISASGGESAAAAATAAAAGGSQPASPAPAAPTTPVAERWVDDPQV